MRITLALLAAGALFAAAPASAQATFGVRGGLNTAFWTGDDADGTEPRLGGLGGAFVRYDLTPAVGVQVEALYSQEGAKEDDGSGTYKLDYVDIPVLVRVAVPVSPYADAGIYAGPSIGIPVKSEFAFDNGAVSDESAKTDIGVTLGADYWAGPIGVDLRYTLGLTEPLKDEIAGVPVEPLDVRNQAFTVSLGYRFGGR